MLIRQNPAAASAVVGVWFLLSAFWYIGARYFAAYSIEYGYSLNIFGPREGTFYFLYLLLGGICVVLISRYVLGKNSKIPFASSVLLEDRRFLFIVALVFVCLSVLVRSFVIQGAPMTDDENAYRLAAAILQSGSIDYQLPSAEIGTLFQNQFIVVNEDRLYTQYYPGFPLLLALADWIHLDNLLNPLLGAVTLYGVYGLANYFYRNEVISLLAVALTAVSPSFLVSSSLLMSHPLAGALVVWGTLLFLTGCTEQRKSRIILGSLLFGFLLLTRPLTVVCLATGILVFLATDASLTRKARLHGITISALVGAAFAVVLLWYNWYLTGDPFKTTYSAFDELDYGETVGFSISLLLQGQQFETLLLPLLRYNFWLFGWPLSFIGIVFAPNTFARNLCLAFFLVTLVIHSFWPSVGVNLAGAFHYIEFLPFLVIPAAAGLYYCVRTGRQWVARASFASAILALLTFYPWALVNLHNLSDYNNYPYRFVEDEVPADSIVFVDGYLNRGNTWTFYRKNADLAMAEPIVWLTYSETMDLESFCNSLQRHCYRYRFTLDGTRPGIELTRLFQTEMEKMQ